MVGRYGRPLVAVGLSMVVVGLGGTVFAVHLVPGSGVAWAMAAPLLLAGVGSGLVIAPNLTLTLSQVPVVGGGSAAGTLQTGQRVGSAIGIAAVGSVFFARLPSAGWRTAFDSGLIVSAAFVLGALVLAMTDVGISRRNTRRAHGLSVPGPSDWKGDHDEPPHRQ